MFEKIYYYDRGKRHGPVSKSEYLRLIRSGKVSLKGYYTIDDEMYFPSDLAFKKLSRGEFRKLARKSNKGSDKGWDDSDGRLGDLFENRSNSSSKWWKFW